MLQDEATVPSEGIHTGVPFEEYLRWDAANASLLKLFKRSAAHARQQILVPGDETTSQTMGHATHAAVLEPSVFSEGYTTSLRGRPGEMNQDGTLPKKTAGQKAEWQEFNIRMAGKVTLSFRDYDYCLAMRDSAWAHPSARPILQARGYSEVSIVWRDKITGLLCKARIDKLGALPGNVTVIGDLKTTKNAAPKPFERDACNYEYHVSAAFYREGLNVLQERDRLFRIIAVENYPPHAVAVYEYTEEALEQGRLDFRRYLHMYRTALETGKWPGYHPAVQALTLPKWAFTLE